MKVAAIQLNADFADVEANIMKSEQYVKIASSNGAQLVLLPEFFTSAIGFSDKMLDVAHENRSVKKSLLQWSMQYDVIVGGSYIAFDGNNAYNRFTIAFPDGKTFEHKKDIPTQFENCYYTSGDESNVLETPIGNIGVALCWEMIRYDTLKRLSGNVDFVLAGSCWWDLPIDAPAEREHLRQYNQKLALETPVTFAKLLGVPVVHANHCGKVTAWNFPNADKEQTRQLVGATQIIDGNGNVISRKPFSDGEGFIYTELSWSIADRKAAQSYPDKYWIPDLPDSYVSAWENINPKGKEYYGTMTLPYYKASSQ